MSESGLPFAGLLLASDWDGTLSVEGNIPAENLRAIREFQDGGGYFTVISGRTPDYLSECFAGFFPNTYTVGLNGARIEDLRTGEVLYDGFCDDGMLPPLSAMMRGADEICQVIFYRADGNQILTPEEAKRELLHLSPKTVYKTVFLTKTPEGASHLLSLAEATPHDGYEVVRSFPTGVELLSEKSGKGTALMRLKQALGARCAIAVGDFENDISLLRAADIGYAVRDGAPSLLAVAHRCVCPAREGAIADVVKDIKKRGV